MRPGVWAGSQSILPAPERPSLGGHSGSDLAACATTLLRDGGMRPAHLHRAIAEHGSALWTPDLSSVGGFEADHIGVRWIGWIASCGAARHPGQWFHAAARVAQESQQLAAGCSARGRHRRKGVAQGPALWNHCVRSRAAQGHRSSARPERRQDGCVAEEPPWNRDRQPGSCQPLCGGRRSSRAACDPGRRSLASAAQLERSSGRCCRAISLTLTPS